MILKSVVFAMLVCISSQEKTFASEYLDSSSNNDNANFEHKSFMKQAEENFSKGLGTALTISLKAVQTITKVVPQFLCDLGVALVIDGADDGKINVSNTGDYVKILVNVARALREEMQSTVFNVIEQDTYQDTYKVLDPLCSLLQGFKDGKADCSSDGFNQVITDLAQNKLMDMMKTDSEKDQSTLKVIVEDFLNAEDKTHIQSLVRGVTTVNGTLNDQDVKNFKTKYESAKTAFQALLDPAQNLSYQQSIGSIRDTLELLRYPDSEESKQQKVHNLIVKFLLVVLKDAGDGKLDGIVSGDTTPYTTILKDIVNSIPAHLIPAHLIPADLIPADLIPADLIPADLSHLNR